MGTYASALFLLKDTFKEEVSDPDVFEKEFIKFLKEDIELDNEITENVIGFGEQLPGGIKYRLKQDILNKEEEELTNERGRHRYCI